MILTRRRMQDRRSPTWKIIFVHGGMNWYQPTQSVHFSPSTLLYYGVLQKSIIPIKHINIIHRKFFEVIVEIALFKSSKKSSVFSKLLTVARKIIFWKRNDDWFQSMACPHAAWFDLSSSQHCWIGKNLTSVELLVCLLFCCQFSLWYSRSKFHTLMFVFSVCEHDSSWSSFCPSSLSAF